MAAIVEGGIASAVGLDDWAEVIKFRLIRAQWCRKRNDSAGVKAEHDACLALLPCVPETAVQQQLAAVVERLGRSLGSDDLRARERDLIVAENAPGGNEKVAEGDETEDFNEALDRLLSSARRYMSLGHLAKAAAAVAAADDLAVRRGVVGARAQVLSARAQLASDSGELESAVRVGEECLAMLEGMVEPGLATLGGALGRVGAYRVIALEQADLPHDIKAASPELTRAVEVLERSLKIHRTLGERRDIIVNLVNLGLAARLKFDVIGELRHYLEALRLCADFDPDAGPTILFPNSCLRLWTNITSVSSLLRWAPEVLMASEVCLGLIADQLSALILEDNKLMSLPERDRIGQFAISAMWDVIGGPSREPVEAGRQGEDWDTVRSVRSELADVFERYGFCLADELKHFAQSGYTLADEARVALRRHLWELMEDTKSRVLREQLRAGLRPPDRLPLALREREAAAFEARQATTQRVRAGEDVSNLKATIEEAARHHETLMAVWEEMEKHGDDAAEYARLRSGRGASFDMILAYVSGGAAE